MSSQADELSDINRKHRQRMMMLKNRTENVLNRPTAFARTRSPLVIPTNHTSTDQPFKSNVFDILKQYESNKTSQPDSEQLSKQKSFDYNSTLFKYMREESQIAGRDLEAGLDASQISGNSAQTAQVDNQLFRDSNLLKNIDELLGERKKSHGKGIRNVYGDFLEKKSVNNSALDILSSSSVTSSVADVSEPKSKANPVSRMNKLKTIEQQKATITLRDQNPATAIKKPQPQPKSAKKPPLAPLASSSTIERQKKKLQETMKELKKEQKQLHEYVEKDSLVLEFSDNESEPEKPLKVQPASDPKQNLEGNKNQLRQKLRIEKQNLMKQLEQIERQLQGLEREQEQQAEDT